MLAANMQMRACFNSRIRGYLLFGFHPDFLGLNKKLKTAANTQMRRLFLIRAFAAINCLVFIPTSFNQTKIFLPCIFFLTD